MLKLFARPMHVFALAGLLIVSSLVTDWPLNIAFVICTGLAIFTGLATVYRRMLKNEERNRVYSALETKIDELVSLHQRALCRKRFQLVEHDDYGNERSDRWDRELDYFIKKVIRPELSAPENQALNERLEEIAHLIDSDVVAMSRLTRPTGPPLSPVEFERTCAEKLCAAGWTCHLTKATGDQGADVIAEKNGIRLVLQCKLYSQPVGNSAVQEAAAARAHECADYAAVVSTAEYTRAAKQLAKTNKVLLLNDTELSSIDDLLAAPARL